MFWQVNCKMGLGKFFAKISGNFVIWQANRKMGIWDFFAKYRWGIAFGQENLSIPQYS